MEFTAASEVTDGIASMNVNNKIDETEQNADDNDSDNEEEPENEGGTDKKKRKRKKKSKKKSNVAKEVVFEMPKDIELTPPLSRKLGGNTNYYMKYGQTNPPTVPIFELFPSKNYPLGEMMEHSVTKFPISNSTTRCSLEEKRYVYAIFFSYFLFVTLIYILHIYREKELLQQTLVYEKARAAAECHKQVRSYMQSVIKPGIKLIDMCEQLEECNRKLIRENGLECGIAFPTGCSINDVAAHYTPNSGDNTVLKFGDVMKIDFGTQVDGRIIDSAYTVSFDPIFDPLLDAVKDATNTGIRASGIDVQLTEIGAQIQEVMESYEITLPTTIRGYNTFVSDNNGASTSTKTYQIKCCRNLHGHSIGQYEIHGGKSVPIVANGDTTRMVEHEMYAIETFGSTGEGYVVEKGECSHYMKNYSENIRVPLKQAKSRALYSHINKTFSSLAFCRRWLERMDGGSYAVNKHNVC